MIKQFFSVYLSLFRTAGFFISALMGIGIFAFLLTFPLWFAATHFPRVYTTAVLAVAALFLLYLLVRRVRAASGAIIAASAIRLLKALFLMFLLYLAAGFLASGRTGVAVMCAILLIGSAGFFRRGTG